MNEYIGTFRVTAIPRKQRAGATQETLRKSEPVDGYFVTYPNGYEKWLTKEFFEANFKPVEDKSEGK